MTNDEIINRINRREAIQRVTAMLGGLTLIGGSSLIAACEKAQERAADTTKAAAAGPQQPIGEFSVQDIAYHDKGIPGRQGRQDRRLHGAHGDGHVRPE
jgi:hypothetical protein